MFAVSTLTQVRFAIGVIWLLLGVALLRFLYRAHVRTGASSMMWLAVGFELVIVAFSLRPIVLPLFGVDLAHPAFSIFEGIVGLIGLILILYSTFK